MTGDGPSRRRRRGRSSAKGVVGCKKGGMQGEPRTGERGLEVDLALILEHRKKTAGEGGPPQRLLGKNRQRRGRRRTAGRGDHLNLPRQKEVDVKDGVYGLPRPRGHQEVGGAGEAAKTPVS